MGERKVGFVRRGGWVFRCFGGIIWLVVDAGMGPDNRYPVGLIYALKGFDSFGMSNS